MAQLGRDLGFIGPAYQAPMILQDAETCINFYCEVAESANAKMPVALLGCPGLNEVANTGVTGAVRGCWVLPGSQEALFCVDDKVGVMSITVPATQTSIPQYSASIIGTVLTNSGAATFRDNGALFGGAGGFAVMVDGQYGYYCLLDGNGNYTSTSRTVTFTGSIASGSPTITLGPGAAIPYGLVITPNATITDTSGYSNGLTLTGVDFNALTLAMSGNATGSATNTTITITIPSFGQITDPAFLPASRVAFVEGWLVFSETNTRTFFSTAATPYTLLFDGGFYALKDSSSDNLVTLYENNRELWLVGERTSEVWYNAGNANFPFLRIPAVGPQIGCAATNSITRMGTTLCWLARNEQGQNIVVQTNQYSWERISNHGIEDAIAKYPVVSDAIGYCYEEDGHLFYVLTFPTADVTWVFDAQTGFWHQRLSFSGGVFHRHRSNCFMDFGDVRIVGDYQNGLFYQMSRSFYSDNGAPLIAQRRTGPVWSNRGSMNFFGNTSRKRIFHGWIQIEFTPGVGLQTGQGSNPQAMLRWSDDGGFTWSNEHWASIGAAGETKNRAIWRRLGRARDRVYELTYSDPTVRDIIGATVFYEDEDESEAA